MSQSARPKMHRNPGEQLGDLSSCHNTVVSTTMMCSGGVGFFIRGIAQSLYFFDRKSVTGQVLVQTVNDRLVGQALKKAMPTRGCNEPMTIPFTPDGHNGSA